MTNEYMEAIGHWEHIIGEIRHDIVPIEEDNYTFIKAKNNPDTLFFEMGKIYFKMVLRAYPKLNKEEQDSLRVWISININQIIQDFLVVFKWVTKEKMLELDEDIKKKNLDKIK